MRNILDYDKFIDVINEKLITFGKKAYPDYDNVVVMAGGAGSGKSFVAKHVLGIEAKTLSTDDILVQFTKFEDDHELSQKFKKIYGKSMSQCDLGNPEDCEALHNFVNSEQTAKKQYSDMFNSIFSSKYKPNIIFDVTLKKYPKIEDISGLCMIGGYEPKNIHLVWVLNKYDTAKEQNAKRERKLPEERLLFSHKGCADIMKSILNASKSMGMIDGDIWIYFGSTNTGDTELIKSDKDGKYIKDFCAVKVKEAGKQLVDYETMMNTKVNIYDINHKLLGTTTLKDKINEYIPQDSSKY